MSLAAPLLAELKYEADTTRRVLERVPESSWDWKPHEKSMSMSQLAAHVTEMFSWAKVTMETAELDFAEGYEAFTPKNSQELLNMFEKNVTEGINSIESASDESFMQKWKLRSGEQIYFEMPRIHVMRSFVLNHVIHHRGQLSVYLRLQNVPVPSIYGPSADEGAS